jgi:hypothetical protein
MGKFKENQWVYAKCNIYPSWEIGRYHEKHGIVPTSHRVFFRELPHTLNVDNDELRAATKEEIKEHLIKIAKEKGFTKGTKVYCTFAGNPYTGYIGEEFCLSDSNHLFVNMLSESLNMGLYNPISNNWSEIIKENQMKITSYKCIKAYPGVKLGAITIENRSAYPEFWEPQYQEEFKVGDYVIMENAGGWSYSSDNNGCLAIVLELGTRQDNFPSPVTTISGVIQNPRSRSYVNFSNIPIINRQGELLIRKATPEEIQKAQEITLGQHKVTFKENSFKVGCTTYFKDDAVTAYKVLQLSNMKELRFGDGTTVNRAQIESILEKLGVQITPELPF